MKKLIVGILLVAGIATGCDKIEEACESEKPTSALIFDFPDSIQAEVPYILDINYVLDNGCGSFKELDVKSDFYVYEIQVMTTYEGCNCDQNFKEGKVDFVMNMSYPGIYEFKFWIAENDYDSYSLKVYE